MTPFTDLNLNKPLLRALEDLQLENATPVQARAFPVIMSGRDAVGIAQTGTGKTFAYLLPILRQLTFSEQRHPRVLILVPTRELVAQVAEEAKKLSKYMSIRIKGIYGASNINTQKQAVYDGCDVLVATPGRLIDLTHSRSVQFNDIKKLVIDEVDEMLNLGFRPQLVQILDKLPEKRQNLLFSATLSEEVDAVIRSHFRNPEYIEVHGRGTPLKNIRQEAYKTENFFTKINLLTWLSDNEKNFSKVLLFVRNRGMADTLKEHFPGDADTVEVIHSNKSQPHRFEAVKRFQEGSIRFLIATDVIARGLDLRDVSHVINFDIPSDPSVYIHRIGRTGRADRQGIAIGFVTEKDLANLRKAEESMDQEITFNELPEDVEVSENLLAEEIPVKKDKSLRKIKKIETPTGAFHEKKAKNKKVQLGGKRRQEKQRRALEKSRRKRG